jgi:hypothetical protein
LGLKNGSSGEIAVVDLAMNIVAFESMNKCRIVLTMEVYDRHGHADVRIQATAYDRASDPAVHASLASVTMSAMSTGMKTLDAALIHVLYLLDGELGRNALSGN